jgi:hypothetical protein
MSAWSEMARLIAVGTPLAERVRLGLTTATPVPAVVALHLREIYDRIAAVEDREGLPRSDSTERPYHWLRRRHALGTCPCEVGCDAL